MATSSMTNTYSIHYSTTIAFISLQIRRICWSLSWRLRSSKFSREIRTSWLSVTSFTPFRANIVTFKMKR